MTTARPLEPVIRRMQRLLAPLEEAGDSRRYFLGVYLRTTLAVDEAIVEGRFVDAAWMGCWDTTFADLYLDAVEQWSAEHTAPVPWGVAFAANEAADRLPPVRHLLLGMNAHINYDLPQALLTVITDAEFDDPAVLARRQADHRRIDEILASRVPIEDRELRKVELPGDRTILDHLLTPLNRRASRRFLTEARTKVWRNAAVLNTARREGTLDERVAELERLSGRRVADLRAPGQVVLRLARHGFGVELSTARNPGPGD